MYKLTGKFPLARFYYKGNHSHPIRRTVLLTKVQKNKITGYELREGKIKRDFKDAPIKSYLTSKIAKKTRNNKEVEFSRYEIIDLIKNGI